MPEHIHLIIEPARTDPPMVPRLLRSLKQPVAQAGVARERRRVLGLAPITTKAGEHRFWQEGGGFDRNIRTLKELRREIDYIHHNPVERELVERPEDWEWSSARWFKGIREGWGGRIPMDRSRVDWGLQEP